MGTQAQIDQVQQKPQIPHWNLATRVAFRFCEGGEGEQYEVREALPRLSRAESANPGFPEREELSLYPSRAFSCIAGSLN
jgi:elongation factor P hydroxylase